MNIIMLIATIEEKNGNIFMNILRISDLFPPLFSSVQIMSLGGGAKSTSQFFISS